MLTAAFQQAPGTIHTAVLTGLPVGSPLVMRGTWLTGEACCAGAKVTAGTVNCEGRLTVRVEAAGAATAVAEIVRSVEAAQARAAPVQRLADRVAGRFAVGVMAASVATFAFWALAAPRLLPQARLPLPSPPGVARHTFVALGLDKHGSYNRPTGGCLPSRVYIYSRHILCAEGLKVLYVFDITRCACVCRDLQAMYRLQDMCRFTRMCVCVFYWLGATLHTAAQHQRLFAAGPFGSCLSSALSARPRTALPCSGVPERHAEECVPARGR